MNRRLRATGGATRALVTMTDAGAGRRALPFRIAAQVATAALVLAGTAAMSVTLAGEASAATRVQAPSGCYGYPLYSRGGAAGEIGNGIGDHDPVGAKGYCSGSRPYRIQVVCEAHIVQGPKVRSGYSTAYCPKGKQLDAAYIFRT